MALTNAQFDEIKNRYDNTRLDNQRILSSRRDAVYKNIEGYKELDDSTISVSMDMAKRKMNGDENAIEELHALLADLKEMKQSLLKGAGYPQDYLDPIYTCPDCKDTGYIGREKCHCLVQQEINILYAQSNIREMLKENNFSVLSDKYYSGEDLINFTETVAKCHDFVNSFDTLHPNMILYGDVGTGKSFLSACMAKELMDLNHSVIYFSAISIFEELARGTFDAKAKEDLYNLYEYIYNCDLLIIDDLGTELTNSFVSNQLFACINERSLRKKSTVISTNLTLQQIRDRYSDRVFSRIVSGYTACKLSGRDIRILKKAAQ